MQMSTRAKGLSAKYLSSPLAHISLRRHARDFIHEFGSGQSPGHLQPGCFTMLSRDFGVPIVLDTGGLLMTSFGGRQLRSVWQMSLPALWMLLISATMGPGYRTI
jgi:hypothetical protein